MKIVKTVLVAIALAIIAAPLPSEALISHAEAKRIWNKVAEPTALTALPFYIKDEKTPNAWVTNGESVYRGASG